MPFRESEGPANSVNRRYRNRRRLGSDLGILAYPIEARTAELIIPQHIWNPLLAQEVPGYLPRPA
jgi:hypothetical protein